jgi:hypothetical protein
MHGEFQDLVQACLFQVFAHAPECKIAYSGACTVDGITYNEDNFYITEMSSNFPDKLFRKPAIARSNVTMDLGAVRTHELERVPPPVRRIILVEVCSILADIDILLPAVPLHFYRFIEEVQFLGGGQEYAGVPLERRI